LTIETKTEGAAASKQYFVLSFTSSYYIYRQ